MISAIILLAGNGERCFNNTKKQYVKINNKDLFLYSFETFLKIERISSIYLVADSSHLKYVTTKVKNYKTDKEIHVISGGNSRKASVFNALNIINNTVKCDYVIIHDAARPFVNEKIINDNIDALKKYDAVTTFIKEDDSIALTNNLKIIDKYLNREKIIKIQTPQSFKFDIIYRSHLKSDALSFDDGYLVYQNGTKIGLVKGDKANFKVTSIDDFKYAEWLIKNERN